MVRAITTGGLGFKTKLQSAADDGLETGRLGVARKLQCTKQVVGIRDGNGRCLVIHGLRYDPLEGQGPLKKRVGGMDPQIDDRLFHAV